eukprot:3170582-Rhodomonas_salina.1
MKIFVLLRLTPGDLILRVDEKAVDGSNVHRLLFGRSMILRKYDMLLRNRGMLLRKHGMHQCTQYRIMMSGIEKRKLVPGKAHRHG